MNTPDSRRSRKKVETVPVGDGRKQKK
jgi:hypothetical protein